MKKMLDALWRAVAYCLYPPVMVLSLLPLGLFVVAGAAFAFFGWNPAVNSMRGWLQGSALESITLRSMDWLGLSQHKNLLPITLTLFASIAILVCVCLLVIALLTTPAIVRIVAPRRFPDLEKKHGGTILASIVWSAGYTLAACMLLLLSIPLWLLPFLALIVPALIGGWLTAKVLSYDILADYASPQERVLLLKHYRMELLIMGVVTGLLGSIANTLWASGVLFIGLFVIMVPIAFWLYTLIFIFSALWFSHFCLRALEQLRQENIDSSMNNAAKSNATATNNPFVADDLLVLHNQTQNPNTT